MSLRHMRHHRIEARSKWFKGSKWCTDATLIGSYVPAATAGDAMQDPPSRVGRLSYLTGKVLLHPPGDGDWTAAARHYPVTTGETIKAP
jgi:hypothetical protein